MNNNVYKGDVQPNHKEYSVWIDSKGVIKTFDGNEWKVSSGGGIPIVDSEDKIESLGLKQGELVGVAIDNTETLSFRDLIQPTNDMLSNPSLIENLSQVSGVSFSVPDTVFNGDDWFCVAFVRKGFADDNWEMISIYIWDDSNIGVDYIDYAADSCDSFILINFQDGAYVINKDNVGILNDVLVSDEWFYYGSGGYNSLEVSEEEFVRIDKFAKAVIGSASTELFIKEHNNVGKIALYSGLKKLEQTLPKTGYPVELYNVNFRGSFEMSPNIYYRINSNGADIRVALKDGAEENVSEYVMEFTVNGNVSVSFPSSIKWSGEPPTFESGSVVVISIVNNLAVSKTF